MTYPSKTPGEALTALLTARGDPLGAALAKELEVSSMTVYRWRTARTWPVASSQLADYFDCTIDEFINWEEDDESFCADTKPHAEGANNGSGGSG